MMMSFTTITALLLYSLSWISVSDSVFQTVQVRLGEEEKLLCSNFTSSPSQIYWFRLVDSVGPCCISSLFNDIEPATFCKGVQDGKYETTSNSSTLFLKIKHVDLSDAGLYFCGYYIRSCPVIVSASYLNVQEKSDGTNMTGVILGAVIVFLLLIIIGLLVKIRKLLTAEEESDPQQNENQASDELNYAVVTFQPKAKRRVVEPNVVYAATR